MSWSQHCSWSKSLKLGPSPSCPLLQASIRTLSRWRSYYSATVDACRVVHTSLWGIAWTQRESLKSWSSFITNLKVLSWKLLSRTTSRLRWRLHADYRRIWRTLWRRPFKWVSKMRMQLKMLLVRSRCTGSSLVPLHQLRVVIAILAHCTSLLMRLYKQMQQFLPRLSTKRSWAAKKRQSSNLKERSMLALRLMSWRLPMSRFVQIFPDSNLPLSLVTNLKLTLQQNLKKRLSINPKLRTHTNHSRLSR